MDLTAPPQPEPDDLFSVPVVPAAARPSHPGTSHLAATTVNVTKHQQIVLDLLADGPGTHEELIARARAKGLTTKDITDQSIRSRCSKLRDYGLVEACGKARAESGLPSTIWRRVERTYGEAS